MLTLALLAGVRPVRAVAATSFVDSRVTALTRAALLSRPGSSLVDARRQRVAVRFRRYSRPLFFAWSLSQIGALFYLWASGRAARLRDALRKRIGPIFPMRFAYGALVAYLSAFAALPAALVRFRFDYIYGMTSEKSIDWPRDGFTGATLDALLVGAIVACVFALVDRTRLWYLWAMAGLCALTLLTAFLEPVVTAPLFNHFRPLAATSPLRKPLVRLEARAGIGNAPIEVADFSRRSHAIVADVAGFGPTKRIVLGDELLSVATPGEVLFLTAREFGHYAHGDDFRLSLFWTLLFIVCTALAVVLADRMLFRRDDDPLARLPLVFAFLGALALIATPVYNGYSRNLESRADAYALALTADRPSAVRAFVRIADETLAPLCPARLVRDYLYNSPPLGTRIAKVQRSRNPCP